MDKGYLAIAALNVVLLLASGKLCHTVGWNDAKRDSRRQAARERDTRAAARLSTTAPRLGTVPARVKVARVSRDRHLGG